MSLDFSPRTTQTQQRMLSRHLPDGKIWENKYNLESNLGKLLLGLASEYFRLSLLIEEVLTETDINQSVQLIEEWQESVGIPDQCFNEGGTLEEQRRNILLKFNNFGGIQTAEDFENLATLLGFTASVNNGNHNGIFTLGFPIRFFDSRKSAVHTIIVDLEERREVFPLSFALPFTSQVTGIIECLFRRLAPANCQILFRYGATI